VDGLLQDADRQKSDSRSRLLDALLSNPAPHLWRKRTQTRTGLRKSDDGFGRQLRPSLRRCAARIAASSSPKHDGRLPAREDHQTVGHQLVEPLRRRGQDDEHLHSSDDQPVKTRSQKNRFQGNHPKIDDTSVLIIKLI